MIEWSCPVNPFNSMKCLLHREHLAGCARKHYLPPVTVAIDPSAQCNLDCVWCNARKVRGIAMMTREHLMRFPAFLYHWGVGSTCVAGGGEPLTHPACADLLRGCWEAGLSNSLITNGTLFDDDSLDATAKTCRWAGISVDAGAPATYANLKNTDAQTFWRVMKNIRRLRDSIDKARSKCEIGYKFLIHPENQYEIADAARLARDSGAHDFQARPVGWTKEPLVFDFPAIEEQFSAARQLEGPGFRVYAVTHKFEADFKKKIRFTKCRALPMHPTFGADGNVHLCFDRRGDPGLVLCPHYPSLSEVLAAWDSPRHHAMMDAIDPKDCPKCTFEVYNEIVEQGFLDDRFCRDFV